MTDKTETALDLDELATSGFTEGPWGLSPFEPSKGGFGEIIQTGLEFDPIGFKQIGKTQPFFQTGKLDEKRQRANAVLCAAAPSLLSLAISQRDQIAAKDARIRELEDRMQSISSHRNILTCAEHKPNQSKRKDG